MKQNEIYTAQSLSFNPPLRAQVQKKTEDGKEISELLPEAYRVLPDGRVHFALHAPGALSVVIESGRGKAGLVKHGDLWEADVEMGYGFQYFHLWIDDNDVLYPWLPIGFGFARPAHFVDIPKEGLDFFEIRDVPHGSVSVESYRSQTTGRYERCLVYLPPRYAERKDETFPVLYLQHGYGENESGWVYQGHLPAIFDNLLAEGKAEPAIVVMADGMVQIEENGERKLNPRAFEEVLLQDLIPFIERKFRVKTDREHRAMAGLSMGSMQTSRITLRHQDLFAYAGLFSGFLRDFIGQDLSYLDAKYTDTYSKNMKVFFRAMGDMDVFFKDFLEDDAICEEKKLVGIRKVYDGGHEWNVWRECIRDFLTLLFKD